MSDIDWTARARVHAAGAEETYALTKSRVDVAGDTARWLLDQLRSDEGLEAMAEALIDGFNVCGDDQGCQCEDSWIRATKMAEEARDALLGEGE